MLHKLLAGHRSHIRSILSIMLCLALVCGTVASMSVFAAEPETETELATETAMEAAETSEEITEVVTETQTSTESEVSTEAISESVTEAVTEAVEEGSIESTEKNAAATETGETADIASTETASPAVILTGSCNGVDVTVNAPEGAFAEGVTMEVSEADEAAFTNAVQTDFKENYSSETYTIIDAAVVNISFYDANGNKIQPASEVKVTLSGLSLETVIVAKTEEEEDVTADYALAYHINDKGVAEYVEMETESPDQASYTFKASSFSSYGVVNVSIEYGIELTGPGSGSGSGSGSQSGYSQHIDVRLVTDEFEFTQTITESSTQKITVTKVWDDENSDDHSDDSVTVYLTDSNGNKLTDGSGNYYTAVLSESNSWTAAWEGLTLEAGEYSVVEDAVSGYSASTTSVTVGEAGSTTETVKVVGSLELTGINSTLTYTHDGTTYTTTGYTDQTDTLNGKTVYEYHFANKATAGGSSSGEGSQGTSISLSDGDTITVIVTFKATYIVYDSDGNVIASATNKTFPDYEYTETVASANNYCSGNGYDFYVYPEELLESIISEEAKTITVTNTPSTATLTLKKVVEGNMGDTSKDFTFTVSYVDADGKNKTETYKLSDGEEIDEALIVQLGSTVTITESDNSGYDVTATVNGASENVSDGVLSFEISEDSTSVVVTNTKNVKPDTGIDLDTAPYIAILFGVALFGSALLIHRRRRLL